MLHHNKSHKVVELKCEILWDGAMIFFIFFIRNLSRRGVGTELLGGGGVLVGRCVQGFSVLKWSFHWTFEFDIGRCYKELGFREDSWKNKSHRLTATLGRFPSLPGDTKHCILPPIDPRHGGMGWVRLLKKPSQETAETPPAHGWSPNPMLPACAQGIVGSIVEATPNR